jgi:hypothetical protein
MKNGTPEERTVGFGNDVILKRMRQERKQLQRLRKHEEALKIKHRVGKYSNGERAMIARGAAIGGFTDQTEYLLSLVRRDLSRFSTFDVGTMYGRDGWFISEQLDYVAGPYADEAAARAAAKIMNGETA